MAAMYSQLAVQSNRATSEGLKSAAANFCQAAGVIEHLKWQIASDLRSVPPDEMEPATLDSLYSLMLAQAQECFWQKAVGVSLQRKANRRRNLKVLHEMNLGIKGRLPFHRNERPETIAMSTQSDQRVLFTTKGKIAIITLNLPKKLNALTQDDYLSVSQYLRKIALMDDIVVTVLTAKGRFFSAGADVSISRAGPDTPGENDTYKHWLHSFVANNLNTTQAFYSHPKILVIALNGPAVGLSAALTGFGDFVYCTPHTYLLTPFSSLGLVAEGGASRGFVRRLGIAKANEALIMSKKITCQELVQTGYVNKVFDTKPEESDKFLELVLNEIDDRLTGGHLVDDSLTKIKELVQRQERESLDRQGVYEVFGGLERFLSGIPQQEFQKVASGAKKHKL
ncbi:ClpP/crotonase [Piedraia hortae CBS 480.64]|uniref:ClpP/crotonase n=1 Tax=Piedraia hortae CBS 480.64 TaxID=1314780 RepID=A0A6A7C0R9_9PEZI|nr:ClpP/crotonase [Piedraia hortae CBS 480.64]